MLILYLHFFYICRMHLCEISYVQPEEPSPPIIAARRTAIIVAMLCPQCQKKRKPKAWVEGNWFLDLGSD